MDIQVFTDGSATTKGNPGGWGYVIVVDGKKYHEGNGHMADATNNDAELEAAIQGLIASYRYIISIKDQPSLPSVTLVSDSRLILGWANGSYKFKQTGKIERYQALMKLVERMRVKTKWVRGHSGNEYNERCDKLANAARKGLEVVQEREKKKANGDTLIGDKKTGTMCIWYKGVLKIIDLDTNIVENYSRDIHGTRGSMLEIKEERSR